MPGPRGPRGPKPKIKNPGKLFARLMGFIFKKYLPACIIVVICIFVSVLANVQGTMFTKNLIDDYIVPLLKTGSPDYGPLLAAMGRVAVFYGIGVISTFAYSKIMIYVSQGTIKNLRVELFSHMQDLPIRYFDSHAHGDIMSIYTNDIDTLRQLISQSLPQILNSAITVVSVFVSMVILNIPLTILTIVMVIVTTVVTKKFAGFSSRYFLAQQRDLGKVNGFIEEMLNGQKVVKVFCHEDGAKEGFDKVNGEIFYNARNGNRFANVLMPLLGNIGNVMYVVVALVGGALLLTDVPNISVSGMAFSISIVVPFLNMTRQFAGAVGQVSNQVNMVIMGSAGAHRIFALLDEEPETDDGYVTLVNAKENADGTLTECEERTNVWAWKHPHHDGTLTYTKLQGDVRFYDVNFGYTPEKTVLHNVSLYAKPGQKLAFVGSTGAGKTTITNLINRFYDINDGKIRYDGININKIKKADLRRSLGIVLQDTNLFTGTVMENIRYGNLDACDEECIAAAKLAGADDFIRRLPEGYNTMLFGNGSNLSQGQRQLLAIARAAVADPPVMIMDEATSSIDTRTEAIVQRGMDALMTGRTVFVIAHRLSTVRNSNAIMVLDHGRIIERGTHEDLLKLKGTYYQLYTGALELD